MGICNKLAYTVLAKNNIIAVPFIPANPPTQPVDWSAGNSIDPSVTYEPETSFANFAGCPINGQWTIIVQDNLGTDDGWIFEWGLFILTNFPRHGLQRCNLRSRKCACV